jgi:hypothetical protein
MIVAYTTGGLIHLFDWEAKLVDNLNSHTIARASIPSTPENRVTDFFACKYIH